MEKTNNLFDAESPMFKSAIYTCIGLVGLLTICGLIWEFAYWRPRQPKEAKTGESIYSYSTRGAGSWERGEVDTLICTMTMRN